MLLMRGQRVAVVGLGKSGIAAARLCLQRGADVVAIDQKSRDSLSIDALRLEAAGAKLRLGSEWDASLEGVSLIVVSPGVPEFPALLQASKAGVEIISELELGVRSRSDRPVVVAVGGTNGKSTVTTLLGEIFEAHHSKARVFVGGNLGEPLSLHADEPFDVLVLEVSSFQLERLATFHPRVSLLLNVTDDHLDRYPSFQAYADAKGNAFVRQTPADAAIVPVNDAVCLAQAKRGQGRVVSFGTGGDVALHADAIVDIRDGERYLRADILVQGTHNALNVAAAICAARDVGVPAALIRSVLANFQGLHHRMELAGTVNGVRYYDDSKGTNVGASVTALLGVPEARVVLICGGKDKGGSYAPLAEALSKKGRAAVLIGEAAPLIEAAVASHTQVKRAQTMEEAVTIAASLAKSGDAVLLSPACASFDMFRDYAHRGQVFVDAVKALPQSINRKEAGAKA